MKLSDLVLFKTRLNSTLTVDGIRTSIDQLTQALGELTNDGISDVHNDYVRNAIHKLNTVRDELEVLQQSVADQNRIADEEISAMSKPFYVRNYDLELDYIDAQSIRDVRQLYIPPQAQQTFETRIGRYVNWKYPVLEMGCRDGDMTHHLVSGDPLYVVDNFQEFLDVTVNKFNEEYKHRIRPYLVDDETVDFSALPPNQFGFVFSYNYFNYRSIQSIKDYMSEMFRLMRPGGVMMFTYNNADMAPAAAYAESYFMSYMPKSTLVPLIRSIGFDVVAEYDFNPAFSWLEIQKPGTLESIKAHQALGAILDTDPQQILDITQP